MKAIKCELCGSNEIKKVDGEYECQYCHTKYSLEEAQKLMIEGTVEVKGKVKVDDTSKKDNFEKLAERALQDELYEQAYKYYEKLLEIDSENWLYVYKKGICAAWQSTLANFRVDETVKACKNAFNIIEVKKIQIEKEKISYEMAEDINKVVLAFYNLAKNHYTEYWKLPDSAPEYWQRLHKCIQAEEYAIELMQDFCRADKEKQGLYCLMLKNVIVFYCELCKKRKFVSGTVSGTYISNDIHTDIWYKNELRAPIIEKYDAAVKKVKEFETDYNPPILERKATSSGCYVATCVYGSYDCPEVWTLRRFRDYKLAETWYGRAFIHIYYAISPTIVKWFGDTTWFKKLWKGKLDKMVNKLQESGFESTPYKDRNW